MSVVPKTLIHVADSFAHHRADRAQRHLLEHELAAYTTPAQRTDLEALLDQYPDADAEPVREILSRQGYRLAG
jgi:hypothetical protein